jgi:GAF domain-containing protein
MKQTLIDLNDIQHYLSGYWLSDLSNFSSFIFHGFPSLNWAGFYLDDGRTLRLGPFCGKPACFEIPYGKGVCGEAFSRREALLVADVDQFPGHIRCDTASRSELVLPLFIKGRCVGVFDLDSPELARFSEADREQLMKLLQLLSEKLEQGRFGVLSAE